MSTIVTLESIFLVETLSLNQTNEKLDFKSNMLQVSSMVWYTHASNIFNFVRIVTTRGNLFKTNKIFQLMNHDQ